MRSSQIVFPVFYFLTCFTVSLFVAAVWEVGGEVTSASMGSWSSGILFFSIVFSFLTYVPNNTTQYSIHSRRN